MASWRLARSLQTLSGEVRQRWPGTTIWTVGDADHAGRPSDHNPKDHDNDPSTPEVVSAVDVVGDVQAAAVWTHVLGTRDDRCEYMIHDRKVTGADYGWQVRAYTGPNPHTNHVHVSVGRGTDSDLTRPDLYDDPAPWGLSDLEDDDMVSASSPDHLVKQWQHTANRLLYVTGGNFDGGGQVHDRNGSHLAVDGDYGPKTEQATAEAVERTQSVLGHSLYALGVPRSVSAVTQAFVVAAIEQTLHPPEQGEKGDRGPKGDPGDRGPKGDQGPPGKSPRTLHVTEWV